METRLTSAGISTLEELAATPQSQLSDVLNPKEANALLAKMLAYIIVRSTDPDQIGEILPTVEQKSLAVEAQSEPALTEIRLRLNAYLAWLTKQDSWETEILQQGMSPVYLIELSQMSLDELLDRFLNSLNTDQWREIIKARWGLGTTEPKTLEEIGLLYGLTRERIRQIERKAMILL